MTMAIEVGKPAPEFELKDQHGRTVRLTDFRGKQPVALVFYPFAFSGLCTGELCEIRDNLGVFSDGDVQVLAISCDPMHSLRAFAKAEGYEFPLLTDFWPHGAVAQAYGVFSGAGGRADRGTFLIDADGIVRWTVVNAPGEARPLAAYREAIAAL
ncbi:MAG TPA: peroxiredoxin [Kineosporiaceae bacterium]|jgi:peroxiredoxin|nr:peroxiredoxin [Kineosporiaceae bacterium]